MASIKRENIGLLNDKLTVNLTPADYLGGFETVLKKHAKTANIPGFRKGMVPVGMIKKMYGQSVFTDEVLKKVEGELNQYSFYLKNNYHSEFLLSDCEFLLLTMILVVAYDSLSISFESVKLMPL
jgi:hypothetical protein